LRRFNSADLGQARVSLQSINFAIALIANQMDPRDESAFTRVFDALCPRVTSVSGRRCADV
jgi:hypothetical protein